MSLGESTLPELRQHLWDDLMRYTNFFIDHGIDHELGGFMCTLDHDGTPVTTQKYSWFQGRGIWWLCFMHNHLDPNPRYLEMATKTKDFMLKHFPTDPEMMKWNQWVEKDGTVATGPSNDPFGVLFGIEGMLELAKATGDKQLREQALDLYRRKYAELESLDQHGFSHYMLHACLTREILLEEETEEYRKISDRTFDRIMNNFFNPEYNFYNSSINADGTRREEGSNQAAPGHDVEVMWMVMHEALRRGDKQLYSLATERMKRCFEIGWDNIYGGMVSAIKVGEGCYDWGESAPLAMKEKFHYIGEYNYVKSLWSLDESMLSIMNAYARTGVPWAADYYAKCQEVLDRKMALTSIGHPLHIVFTDREFTLPPHTSRKDNFHHPRMLMFNILEIDRLLGKADAWGYPAA